MCAYYVQLFHRPEFLVSRFTKQQLEEGFWAIMGHTVEWSTANIIDDSNLPLSSRKDCIESMAVLFERLFANEPLDTSVHMWWDSLCYAWHCGNRNRERRAPAVSRWPCTPTLGRNSDKRAGSACIA